jgi:nucleotide-binding universal stress UspA family protein
MFDSILVPLDGSEVAERALNAAVELARDTHGKLLILRVVERGYTEPAFFENHGDVARREEHACADAYIDHNVARLRERGLDAHALCIEGEIAESVLYAASVHKAGLIVLSKHGRGHSNAWPIGRNAERIVRNAPCAVLLLPAQ